MTTRSSAACAVIAGITLASALTACSSSTHGSGTPLSTSSTAISTPPSSSTPPSNRVGKLGPTTISSPTQAHALRSQGFPDATCQPATAAPPKTGDLENQNGNEQSHYTGNSNCYLLFPSAKTVEKLSCDNSVGMLLGGIHDNVTLTPKVHPEGVAIGSNWIVVWVDDPSFSHAVPGPCNFKIKVGLDQATVWS